MINISKVVQPIRDEYPEISDEDYFDFLSSARLCFYKKGEKVRGAGDKMEIAALVLEGVFRMYVNSEDGEELTMTLYRPLDFFGTWENLFIKDNSSRVIGAASSGALLVMDFNVLERLLTEKPAMQHVYRRISEKVFVELIALYQQMLVSKPETRYDIVVQWLGDSVDQVPQRILASFLGINPVSLSRIKKRLGTKVQQGN